MNVSVFGAGYVGLVTGACFAESGNNVCCVDTDSEKIERLHQGEVPIHEPDLDEMIKRNMDAGRMHFTTSAIEAISHGLVIFIAVATPDNDDGSSDLRYVEAVAHTIGENLSRSATIVTKSTVPIGTADLVRNIIRRHLQERNVDIAFDVVSNPEFLTEGTAITNCMYPDRIVIGAENSDSIELLARLYAPFNRNHNRLLVMDTRSAELTKYAANAMLATKISFMNEIANIAERVGANIENVRLGVGSDSRIGYRGIYAGIGYGGSCFRKDNLSLVYTASQFGYEAQLVKTVEAVNDRQKGLMVGKIIAHFNGNVSGRVFALWGLAFKPKTDDMRDAPSRVIIEVLLELGAKIKAYDPEAMETAQKLYGDRSGLELCCSRDQTIDGADALIICTEWRQFQSPDFGYLRRKLKSPVIFDGRNIYDPKRLEEDGFIHYGIGLGSSPVSTGID